MWNDHELFKALLFNPPKAYYIRQKKQADTKYKLNSWWYVFENIPNRLAKSVEPKLYEYRFEKLFHFRYSTLCDDLFWHCTERYGFFGLKGTLRWIGGPMSLMQTSAGVRDRERLRRRSSTWRAAFSEAAVLNMAHLSESAVWFWCRKLQCGENDISAVCR